jgi:NAD(P)H-hydrate epimerase
MNHAKKITLKDIRACLTPRPLDAHKGLFGHVMVVGSDYGMPGAARLAAEGALRVGAGLVTVITQKEHISSIMNGRPELLCYGVEAITPLLDILTNKASVIVLGPGLGQSGWSKRLFDKLIAIPQPIVLDADGLNWLARSQSSVPRTNWILTPHPGEAARLLNTTVQEIQKNREQSAQQLQKQYNGVIVLKGAHSIVTHSQKPTIKICESGNPGMASPGMGDLLSGMIAGLVAQGIKLEQAAEAGVMLHAEAADRVASRQGQRGLLASDLFCELPLVINELCSFN